MIRKFWVFVSSTSDLAVEREAVAEAMPMSFEPYLYEKDRARGATPEERLEQVLDDTDVYLGVFGSRYGSVYKDAEQNRSIVEWEFDQAKDRSVELLSFLKRVPEEGLDEDQKRFRDKVKGFRDGLWCRTYSSPEELKEMVQEALAGWSAELNFRLLEEKERKRALGKRLLIPGCLSIALLAFLWLSPIGQALSLWTLAGLVGLAIMVSFTGMLLTLLA